MNKKQVIRMGIGMLVIPVLAACTSSEDQESAVATSVAATMEVSAPTAAPPPTQAPAPTAAPTQTPAPTAIPGNPADALGDPNGKDPFDNANNWTLFNNNCFATTITGGKLVMEAKGALELSCWEVSWPLIKDYYYQSEVVMPVACNANDRFGLFFRAPDNDRGFLFGIQCDGKYSLSGWDGENTNIIVAPIDNTIISTPPESINVIGVVADGSTMSLYANGQFLAQAQNVGFADNGKIGYFVRAAVEDEGFVVQYDNLAIWLLDQ